MAHGRPIRGLDGLRAFSVFLVIMGHGSEHLPEFPRSLVWPRVWNAGLGVTIFFAISGYLITRLLLSEEQQHGRFSLRDFYVRRVFRILPAAFAYLLVLALASALRPVPIVGARDLLLAAFFVLNLWGSGRVLDGHYWSLSVEEQFYLLWPAILLVAPRRAALLLSAAFVVLTPLWGHFNVVMFRGGFNTQRTDLRIGEIFLGVAMALAERDPATRAGWSWLATRGRIVFLVGAACLLVALAGNDLRSRGVPGAAFIALYVGQVGIAGLLLGAMNDPGPVATWVLEAPAIRFVGRLSYSLYLWQQFFLWPSGWGSPSPFFVHPPACYVGIVLAACASYFGVEKPFLRLRDRFTAPTRQPDAAAVQYAPSP